MVMIQSRTVGIQTVILKRLRGGGSISESRFGRIGQRRAHVTRRVNSLAGYVNRWINRQMCSLPMRPPQRIGGQPSNMLRPVTLIAA
jgi:hypothetical protein